MSLLSLSALLLLLELSPALRHIRFLTGTLFLDALAFGLHFGVPTLLLRLRLALPLFSLNPLRPFALGLRFTQLTLTVLRFASLLLGLGAFLTLTAFRRLLLTLCFQAASFAFPALVIQRLLITALVTLIAFEHLFALVSPYSTNARRQR